MAQLEAFDAKLKIDREAAIAEGRPKKVLVEYQAVRPHNSYSVQ